PLVTTSAIGKDFPAPFVHTHLSPSCDANPHKELRRAKTTSTCCHHSPTYSCPVNGFFWRWNGSAALHHLQSQPVEVSSISAGSNVWFILLIVSWTLQNLLWLLGFILELAIAVAVVRRRVHQDYPFFFSYVVMELTRTVLLASIGRRSPSYFYAYWLSE